MQNIARKYKIMTAIAASKQQRIELLCRMMVDAGFARIPSDAKKIISGRISDVDLERCFFIAVSDYKFNESHLTTQRLIRLALNGVPVFIAAKDVPNVYLPFCEIIY